MQVETSLIVVLCLFGRLGCCMVQLSPSDCVAVLVVVILSVVVCGVDAKAD